MLTVAVGPDLVVSTDSTGHLVAVITSEACLGRAQGLGVAGHVIALLGIHPTTLHLSHHITAFTVQVNGTSTHQSSSDFCGGDSFLACEDLSLIHI